MGRIEKISNNDWTEISKQILKPGRVVRGDNIQAATADAEIERNFPDQDVLLGDIRSA